MADVGSMNVKIGADISGLLTKVDAAKAKLNQLTEGNQQLKAGIADLNSSLRLNEAELGKNATALRKLVDGGKGATAEANNLRKAISGLSANSIELNKNLGVAKNQLAATTTQIKTQSVALKEAEAAGGGFAKGATKAYSALRSIANIIPGIGIGGLVALVAGPLVDAFENFASAALEGSNASKLFADTIDNAGGNYAKAIENVSRLKEEIRLAKEGFLDKNKVVKDYNESIGKTTGLVKTLDEAEKALNKNAEAYIRFTFLKAVANEANAQSAKKAVEASLAALKSPTQFVDKGDAFLAVLKNFFVHPLSNTAESLSGATDNLIKAADKSKKNIIDSANSDSNALALMAKKFGDEAAALAKQFKFNPFEDNGVKTGGLKRSVESINDVLEKLRIKINVIRQDSRILDVDKNKAIISAIEASIEHLMEKFKLLTSSPQIIRLRAQIDDIVLTEEFKKILKGGGPNQKIVVPFELVPDAKVILPNNFEALTRDAMREQLKKLHISVALDGLFITTGSSTKELTDTLDDAQKKLQNFKDSVGQLTLGIAEGFGAAVASFADGGKGLGDIFNGVLSLIGDFLIQAGKAAVVSSALFKAIQKIASAPGVGLVAGILAIAAGNILKHIKLPAFAEGGHIKGPGNGKSDSIVARLSAGEYVIPAHIVTKHGKGFFDKLIGGGTPPNYADFMRGKGFPKFASGGFVSPILSQNQNLLSGINIGGGQQIFIAESRLRGQDIVTSYTRASGTINRNS